MADNQSALGGKTVLLAEDELTTLKVMSSSLKAENINVIEAVDGQQAYDLAIAQHPDLVILDIQMPKLDGLTVLEKLRLDDWGKNAEVMLLTNYNDSEKILLAFRQKAFSYLVKSEYDTETLVKKIKEKLNLS